ncbi:MAG: DUF3048 domain-containing protein [Candidatus Saccharimonadales bacterium]
MQGDIMVPRPKRRRPAPKPKPTQYHSEPEADIILDETTIEETPKKQRRVLVMPHKHFIRFWKWWMGLSRNLRFAFLASLLLLFGAAAIGWFYFIQPSSNPSLTIVKHPKPKIVAPLTVASPLTGLQVAPDLAQRPVTAIMIENSDDARPQSGLQDAGVVYEAIAEAGITRFMAFFQDAQPQYIGPVRSLRPYYIDFAAPFQASIVHVGGSPDALAKVQGGGYRNLDEFANGGSFWRITSRAAPHNVYTSFAKLDALNQKRGYTSSTFTGWPRKADKKLATPTAKTIDLKISSADFYDHYDYDAASNSYLRSEGAPMVPHMDLVSASDITGVRLHPKVVIALVVSQSLGALDASGAYYTDYDDIGSGAAYIFQDGGLTVGTWSKDSTSSQVVFADSAGTPIKLDAGQTWITLVSDSNKISYSP